MPKQNIPDIIRQVDAEQDAWREIHSTYAKLLENLGERTIKGNGDGGTAQWKIPPVEITTEKGSYKINIATEPKAFSGRRFLEFTTEYWRTLLDSSIFVIGIKGIRETLIIPGYTAKNEVAEIIAAGIENHNWRWPQSDELVFARRRPSSEEMEQYRQLATYVRDVLGKGQNS